MLTNSISAQNYRDKVASSQNIIYFYLTHQFNKFIIEKFRDLQQKGHIRIGFTPSM